MIPCGLVDLTGFDLLLQFILLRLPPLYKLLQEEPRAGAPFLLEYTG